MVFACSICCSEKEKLKEREEKWSTVLKIAQSNPAVSLWHWDKKC